MYELNTVFPNMADVLSNSSSKSPNELALTYLNLDGSTKENLTFSELKDLSLRVALHLQLNCNESVPIIIALPPSSGFMATLFGCFYAGKVAVPFYSPDSNNMEDSAEKIIAVAESVRTKYVICPASNLDEMVKICGDSLVFLAIEHFLSINTQQHKKLKIVHNALALLLYTSGSTGQPKGVMISHKSLIEELTCFQSRYECSTQDIICTWLPNILVAGLYMRFLGIFLRCRNIIFTPTQFIQHPELWLRSISNYRASISAAPNFAYDLCAKSLNNTFLESLDLSCWRLAISGGEQIKFETLQAFTQRFHQHGFKEESFISYYGLTETLCASSSDKNKKITVKEFSLSKLKSGVVSDPQDEDDKSTYVSNGKPWNSTTIRIVNSKNKRCCGPEELGEIWVKSLSNTQGYWRLEELSEDICYAYTQDTNEGPFFRTGDLGFLKDEELYITGRLKELIIINGKNYYPEDIEKYLLKQFFEKGVFACAAFAVSQSETEKLIILVEADEKLPTSNRADLEIDIKTSVAQRHGINVSDLVILKKLSLPRTLTRKIQRLTCARYYLEGKWKSQSETTSANYFSFDKDYAKKLEMTERVLYITNALKTCFSQTLSIPPDHIKENQPIRCLSVNSITVIKIISQLREKCSPLVSYSAFFGETSINQLADEISIYIEKGSSSISQFHLNYENDLELLDNFVPSKLPEKTTTFHSVLLTGGTGFLGGYLLRDLLEAVSGKVYCLVRAKSEEEALDRLRKNMEKGAGWRSEYTDKIRPVLGDLSQPQLGLSSDLFSHLSSTIDAIYHNGAAVNFVAPYETLKKSNVISLYEVLKLATTSKLKVIYFVSTIAVHLSPDRYNSLPIKENSLLSSPNKIFGGYAQSKWVAEKLCYQAIEKGVPIHIYRPGIISGDSKNGYVNIDDFFCRFTKGCLQMGIFPDIDIEIDMSPVDYVSQSIISLSQQESHRKTASYHLINFQPTTLKKWMAWLKKDGFTVRGVPFEDWLNHVRHNITQENDLYPVLPFIIDRVPNSSMTLLEIFKDKVLGLDIYNTASSGIKCPVINDDLLHCYVNYFKNSGYFSSIHPKNKNQNS